VNDQNIDDLLHRAPSPPVDRAVLDRVHSSMAASMRPVRPLAPAWVLASILSILSAAIAIVSAAALGFFGFDKLSAVELATIFPTLGIFTWLTALVSAAAIVPGSGRWMNPALLLLLILAVWLGADAMLFHDYQLAFFVPQGIPCLRAGIIVAIPAGIASWLVLRRGFAVHPAAAGLAAGTLAGLAGLMMLEIHCPNQNAMHIMVWHTAVVPISALIGAACLYSAKHLAVFD
jgi:hypothetical protein